MKPLITVNVVIIKGITQIKYEKIKINSSANMNAYYKGDI